MCVIVAKGKDKRIPTIEELANCFTRNSDGAGFMYVDNNKVVVDKGYMTFKSFQKHFKKLCKKYNNFDNKALVMHFRIGTAGTNSEKNTHPYIISNSQEALHKQYIKSDLGLVHNGIIYDYAPKDKDIDSNDTQEFIKKYLTPLKENYKEFYKNKYIMDGIKEITGSKFALLDTNEDIYYIGDFVNFNGVMYSNESYKKYEYKSYNNYKYIYNDNYYNNYYDDYETANSIKNYNIDDYLEEKEEQGKEELGGFQDIFKIKKGWYIESLAGDWWMNKEDNLYYNADTMQVLKKAGNEYTAILNEAYIFDENYEQVY